MHDLRIKWLQLLARHMGELYLETDTCRETSFV